MYNIASAIYNNQRLGEDGSLECVTEQGVYLSLSLITHLDVYKRQNDDLVI